MGKGSVELPDFLMSVDYALCYGPVDKLNAVWVKDKRIFCGSASTREDIDVDLPELFGGIEGGEGGVVGVVEFYPGTDTQVASEPLAARLDRTPATMPGYRGLCHLFFRGRGAARRGFRWTSNNPYMPPTEASVTRLPRAIPGVDVNYSILPADPGNGDPNVEVTYSEDPKVITVPLPPILDMGATWHYVAWGGASAWPNQFTKETVPVWPPLTQDMVSKGLVRARIEFEYVWEAIEGRESWVQYWYVAMSARFVEDAEPENKPSVTIESGTFGASYKSPWYNWPETYRVLAIEGQTSTPFDAKNARKVGYLAIEYREEVTVCMPGNNLGPLPQANPAQIIYEAMVNAEWGRGEDPSLIDSASFAAAAETFFQEGFGLTVVWTRQDTIENFIQEMLDHVQAFLFPDPESGLWTLKPLRGDYDPATLPVFDQTNCRATKRSRRAPSELINEIVVSFTDPNTNKNRTVSSHSAAGLQIAGGVVSETREYHAIHSPRLAQTVADRDVREASYPLFSTVLEVSRAAWNTKPGDLIKLDWPEDGIVGMVLRVTKVDYGSPSSRGIRLDCVEDVFGLDQVAYSEPQGPIVPGGLTPRALPLSAAPVAPLPTLQRTGRTVAEVDAAPGSNAVVLMGSDPGAPVLDIQAHTTVVAPDGSSSVQSVATFAALRATNLLDTSAPLVAEAHSTFPAALVAELFDTAPAGAVLFLHDGTGAEEIVMLDGQDGAGDWNVARGVWDTVPRAWGAGTSVWVFPSGVSRLDPTERAAGETVTYRFLPRTELGRLPYTTALDTVVEVTDRAHAPFRPANVTVDGVSFGELDYIDPATRPATITATWSNRNRATEDSQILRWDEAGVAIEPGQTTTIKIIRESDGTVAQTIAGLTGETYTVDMADLLAVGKGQIAFYADRDAIESLFAASLRFETYNGYGLDYGNFYGP